MGVLIANVILSGAGRAQLLEYDMGMFLSPALFSEGFELSACLHDIAHPRPSMALTAGGGLGLGT